MKKKFAFLMLVVCCAISTVTYAQANYSIRVLTFEDKDYKGGRNFVGMTDWSSLIDDVQYMGPLLYPFTSMGIGYESEKDAYKWSDDNHTHLSSVLVEGYGSWCYWSGGHAISNYASNDIASCGDYNNQLTIYSKTADGMVRSGAGHNGSNNFAVHFGYHDYSPLSLDVSPVLRFSDGVARVIDHMYVTNTCYALNCYLEGNGLTAKIGADDWVKIVATADNGRTAEFFLCNGPKHIVTDWTIWDLSSLGEVRSVEFNITGSSDNGDGFSQPAYFAYDDVAVRFPSSEKVEGDMNGDGQITMDDVNILMNKYLKKE